MRRPLFPCALRPHRFPRRWRHLGDEQICTRCRRTYRAGYDGIEPITVRVR